jgi:cytidyltransferase-like protein
MVQDAGRSGMNDKIEMNDKSKSAGFGAKAPYRHKIKTVEQVRELLGSPPRERKVVMCHGAFDIVHPGHLRHLVYAKEHADVLVASITCDDHITKANFRPYVPEELRALNLAALEVVDHVIIDRDPTPLKNLSVLQPDYFAKGYEYTQGGNIHPRTREEIKVLESYGGEMLFTPGDVIYSSSALIEATPPNIAVETLMTTMEADGVTFADLRAALDKMAALKVHVVGDTIVDTLTTTKLIGGLTKTPTFSVQVQQRTDFIGGAAIVAKHLRATGADVVFTTVLGEDPYRDYVVRDRRRWLPPHQDRHGRQSADLYAHAGRVHGERSQHQGRHRGVRRLPSRYLQSRYDPVDDRSDPGWCLQGGRQPGRIALG